jgi:hypothetical protein
MAKHLHVTQNMAAMLHFYDGSEFFPVRFDLGQREMLEFSEIATRLLGAEDSECGMELVSFFGLDKVPVVDIPVESHMELIVE